MVDQVSGMNNPWASAYSNGRSNNGRSNRNNVTTFDDFYSTMLAEDPQLTFAAEVAGGLGSLARSGIKRFARNTHKVNPELDDAINEYMRD